VLADIPMFLTRDSVNNIEDYIYDSSSNTVRVSFYYSSLKDDGTISEPSEVKQIGTITNDYNTEWSLSVKFFVYFPVGVKYLILDFDEELNTCIVGVPDRSMIWIMSRFNGVTDAVNVSEHLEINLRKAAALGYDTSKIVKIPFIAPPAHNEFVETDGRMPVPQTYAEKEALIRQLLSSMSPTERRTCLDTILEAQGSSSYLKGSFQSLL
jgi:lipocalin